MKNKFILKNLHMIPKFRADDQGKAVFNELGDVLGSPCKQSQNNRIRSLPFQTSGPNVPSIGKLALDIGGNVRWQRLALATKQIFCVAVYLMVWAATSTHVLFGSIEGISSLGVAPPSTDLGKNSSPAFSDDQVNATGAFSYSYPLTLPAGRHGVKPMISLSYSSDAPLRGGLAAGWSLNIPSIKGDTSKGTLDPSGNNPAQSNYISNFMGGGPLIRQSNSPVDQGNIEVYYALHDNQYIRYELNKSPVNEPYWRVRTSDGHIYEFGNPVYHESYLAPLYRQIDPFGHVIQYQWEKKSFAAAGGTAYEDVLTKIYYRASLNAEPYAEVAFNYSKKLCGGVSGFPVGAKLDYRLVGENGKPELKGSQQLDSLVIKARRPEADGTGDLVLGSQLSSVRRYDLTYSDSTSSCTNNLGAPLRRLDRIQETVYAPVSGDIMVLPPTEFHYGGFEPAENIRYEERPFSGIQPLPEGKDLEHFGEGLSGVSQVLVDLNGDGLQDVLRRPVGSLDTTNLAYVYYNTGTGFEDYQTVRFPEWLPDSVPDPTDPNFQNKSLGLGGQLKFHADHTDDFVNNACDFDISDRKGSLEKFGLFDVNHDGLPDLVTSLHYDPQRVSDRYLSAPPSLNQEAFSALAIPDPGDFDPNICGLGVRRVRWPAWKVRYNLGGSFSSTVDVVHGPVELPVISAGHSMGTSNPSVIMGRDGNGDFNGDGFRDRLHKGYRTPDDEDFIYDAKGFYTQKDDDDELGDRERWITLGQPDGSLYRVSGQTWQLPMEWISAVKEFGPHNATGEGDHYFATMAGLLDVNGDGLDDLMMTNEPSESSLWQFGYFPNMGQSFITSMVQSSDNFASDGIRYYSYSYSQVSDQQQGLPTTGVSENQVIPVDINADGLVDLVKLTNSSIKVYANNGYKFSRTPMVLRLTNDDASGSMTERLRQGLRSLVYMGLDQDKKWEKVTAFMDMTGDGLKDIIVTDNLNTGERKLYAAVVDDPPFLMHSITNGRGATTLVEYASTADATSVVQGEIDGENLTVRNPKWVVKSITVQPGNQPAMKTTYSYLFPVYAPDLYGRYTLRGFEQRVKISPSGSQVIDTYSYEKHYVGLHKEQITYRAEDLNNPHTIMVNEYGEGFSALHDTDQDMLDTPKNWHLVESTNYTCPVVTPEDNISDSYQHCINNGDKLVSKTDWTTLSYRGDGMSGSVPTIRVPESELTIFDDGFGVERKLITTTQYEIRADADEYLVREKMIVTRDRSQTPSRIVSDVRKHWNNQLRELGLDSEYVYEDNVKVATKITRYEYDERGLVTQIREPKEYAQGGYAGTRFEYDDPGVTITKETNPLGHVVKSITDIGTGETLLTKGPNSTLNTNGEQVYERVRLAVDGLGRILEKYVSVDDEVEGYIETLVERNTYQDNVANYNGVSGTRVTNEALIDSGAFSESTTIFDGIGREIYSEQMSMETANAEIRYHWDDGGQVVQIDVPSPASEGQQVSYHFAHDSLGRQTQTTGPDGSVLSTMRYQGLTTITSEIGEPNAPAAEKRLTNNVADQLIKVEEKLDDGSYAVTTYQYDGAGSMEVITDPEGVITLMMHDSAGRRIAIAAGGQTWEYEYDLNDNLTAIVNPHPTGEAEAYTTRMEYDLLNRMTRSIPASADLNSDEKTEFAWGEIVNVYDQPHPLMGESSLNYIGRLGYSTSPIVTNMFRYNAQGQPTEHRQILDIDGLGEASGVELVTNTSYYDNGQLQLKSVTDRTAGKSLVTNMHHEYDSRGLPMRISAESEIARLVRNHAGLVTQRRTFVAGNHVVANYIYDDLGRVIFAGALQSPSGARPFNQWYTYYANGMVKKIQEKPADGKFRSMSFIWDTRHQVKKAIQGTGTPGYSAIFDYNRAGRLMKANVALSNSDSDVLSKTRVHQRDVSYVYNDVDPQRVDQLTHNSDNSTYADYDYDRAGNIIKRVIGDDTWHLRYDGENRLRKVTNMTDNTAEVYFYDGANRVLSVRYTNDSMKKVRRWFAGGEIHYHSDVRDKSWYYAELGQTVARIENGTDIEYLFQTPQGHEALSMNADGSVNTGKLYGPFGEVLYSELVGDKSPEDYTREFNGKDYDCVSGLHYYGYRYYDPIALIWNRADPMFRFMPDKGYTEPRQANLYVYTSNNPVSLIDPDGLNPVVVRLIAEATDMALSEAKSQATSAIVSFFTESPVTEAINNVVFSDNRAIDFGRRLTGTLENMIFNAAGSRFKDGYVIAPAAQGVLNSAIKDFSEAALEIERAREAYHRVGNDIESLGGDPSKPKSKLYWPGQLPSAVDVLKDLRTNLEKRIDAAGKKKQKAGNRIENIMRNKKTYCKLGERGCKKLPRHQGGVTGPEMNTNHGREE